MCRADSVLESGRVAFSSRLAENDASRHSPPNSVWSTSSTSRPIEPDGQARSGRLRLEIGGADEQGRRRLDQPSPSGRISVVARFSSMTVLPPDTAIW